MKAIKEKYTALWKMIPELYPLRTMEEISVYNKSFRINGKSNRTIN